MMAEVEKVATVYRGGGRAAGEARELALLLRSGSLSTGIYPIEERAIGPSLGKDNIDKGVHALVIGMAGVFLFMAVYYRTFGLVADVVLQMLAEGSTALKTQRRIHLVRAGVDPVLQRLAAGLGKG